VIEVVVDPEVATMEDRYCLILLLNDPLQYPKIAMRIPDNDEFLHDTSTDQALASTSSEFGSSLSVLRAFAFGGHLDQFGIKPGNDFHKVGLSRHYRFNILITHRYFVETGRNKNNVMLS
jgi:hypothetical protein